MKFHIPLLADIDYFHVECDAHCSSNKSSRIGYSYQARRYFMWENDSALIDEVLKGNVTAELRHTLLSSIKHWWFLGTTVHMPGITWSSFQRYVAMAASELSMTPRRAFVAVEARYQHFHYDSISRRCFRYLRAVIVNGRHHLHYFWRFPSDIFRRVRLPSQGQHVSMRASLA